MGSVRQVVTVCRNAGKRQQSRERAGSVGDKRQRLGWGGAGQRRGFPFGPSSEGLLSALHLQAGLLLARVLFLTIDRLWISAGVLPECCASKE